MAYTTVISQHDAVSHLRDPDWLFVDCRFVLGQPDKGYQDYLDDHIAGAVYAHLDRDLSGPVVPGRTGRHPLPSEAAFDATASRLGIGPDIQVVAYDGRSGELAAARLWWLLKWAGHDAVAVLEGGFQRWLAAGLPTAGGDETRAPGRFAGRYRASMVAGADDVLAAIGSTSATVIDSRAQERYQGKNETIDPVAGHIPGAISLPFAGNVDSNGDFLPPDTLRARFTRAAPTDHPESVIFYCGSGVTAAHNILAYNHSGLGLTKLYPGSWSEWITDPSRPIATGADDAKR